MSTELAALSWNPISDWNQLTTYPFMVHALEAGTIVAVLAGTIGWFMVLRRQTFAGHTLAVIAFPGAAAASLAGLPLAVGYYGFCGLGALALAAIAGSRRSHASESAAIGTLQALVLGLAVAETSQITGALLVFALLVAPAATAQQLTARPAVGACLAVALALA